MRRVTQGVILLLFFGTAHWGWTLFERPVLTGNLSGSELLGVIPMADPFAVIQILFTRHLVESDILLGGILILAFYALFAGRAFCAWVCPLNIITDLAKWTRRRLRIKDLFKLSRNIRYTVLALSILLSLITGVAAFEWISPISMLHRELIFGIGLGWSAIVGVFVFDLFVMKNGWCGHLCPLGAFYALISRRTASLVVNFDASSCTRCGECATVCPEPQVLDLKKAFDRGLVEPGECTRCGRCTTLCAEDSLKFSLRRPTL